MTENTEFTAELGRLGSGGYPPIGCTTETEWHDLWEAEAISNHEPLVVALIGGALADRLDWVFHAGYQGMMRYAFPFCPKPGWASYLVAEDKTGEYPGAVVTQADGINTLSGYKSWVAASDHVDHLIVRAKRGDEEVVVLAGANDAGVELSSREKPGFLADLSQGFAAFKDVVIKDDRVFSNEQLHENFAYSEPFHVLTALNAFIASQTLGAGGDADILNAVTDSLRLAGNLVGESVAGDDFFLGVADLDTATTELAQLFEPFIERRDSELFQRWQQSRGVVNMFSRGLQKRAKWLREY